MLMAAIPTIARAATLTDTPSFTANEIYELMSTDPVEGAALGASFGGIGVDNQPHQQLANRTALLNNHRVTDEGNIASLQAFVALFTGTMGQNGYMKLPVADTNLGQIQYVIEWGTVSVIGQSGPSLRNAVNAVSFPLPFPHACVWANAQWQVSPNTTPGTGSGIGGAFRAGMMTVEVMLPGTTTGMSIFTDWDDSANIFIASSPTGQGLTGLVWIAIGY